MNQAQGCLSGWQERFPLAASVPCPPRHPLGDVNFPTPVYSWVADGQTKAQRGEASPRCRRVNRSSGCQAWAGNQTWGCSWAPSPAAAFVLQRCPGQDLVVPVPKQTTFRELQPVPTWSPGTPHLHPCSPLGPAPPGSRAAAFLLGAGARWTCCSGNELVLPMVQAPLKSSSILGRRKVKPGYRPP